MVERRWYVRALRMGAFMFKGTAGVGFSYLSQRCQRIKCPLNVQRKKKDQKRLNRVDLFELMQIFFGTEKTPLTKAVALALAELGCDDLFIIQDRHGLRPIRNETARNPWPRACKKLGLEKPWPRFHDLRHTWKTNARRSGMDPEIREAILGHSTKERSVSERYGRISNRELVEAIDSMTFDHGETEILVAKRKSLSKECTPERGHEKMLTGC